MDFWRQTGLDQVFPRLILEKILNHLHYVISIDRVVDDSGLINEFDRETYDAYHVLTNQGMIKLAISNYHSCCEQWGLTASFNSEVIDNDYLTPGVKTKNLRGPNPFTIIYNYQLVSDEYSRSILELETNQGLYQLSVFNDHNGYYSHEVVFIDHDGKVEQSSL